VSSVYEVRWRVLRERLERIAEAADRVQNEDGVRVALCCVALLDRHRIDGKGRCRRCRRRRGWWRRERRCTVLPLLDFYLEQPSEMVSIMVE
jgi:uncharacterized paraquat-inducible protein A